MKNYILILLFVISLSINSYSQYGINYETKQAIELYNTNKLISGGTRSSIYELEYEGSPYLNEEFVNGSIFTVSKLQYDEVPLRYNIFIDELEFKTPSNEILALAAPDIVEKAVLGDITLAYLTYLQSNKTKGGFFIIIEEGKASLFVKPYVLYKEATEPAAYKDAEPPKFVKKSDEYYLKTGTGLPMLISNKKDLISFFPDNQDKISDYISNNKIKTNKTESLKELVKYYNSL